MAEVHDTLLRQWQMLRNIPKFPRKITASELTNRLEREHFKVSKRTIERDLHDLSSVFPLALDDRNRPYGWSWERNAPAFNLPGIDKNEALALLMLEGFLSELLPSSTLDVLAPHFKLAKSFLDHATKEQQVKSWINKVRAVSANQPLLPPKIDPEVQRTISESLLMDRQCLVTYQRPNHLDLTEYRIHPLAMTQRGGIIYLTVKMFDYDDIRTLALHRMRSAKMLEEAAHAPQNFDIDKEISQGLFGFGRGEMTQLKALFSPEMGQRLIETNLSQDQSVEVTNEGRYLITATVADTPQLQWWLLSLGTDVEIKEPLHVREAIATAHQKSADLYR